MANAKTVKCCERPIPLLPYDMDYLTDDMVKKAKSELFEDEDTKTHSLVLLRKMLNEETDLHWQDEELFLLSFLRARKFDVKRALTLMKAFYKTREKRGELYDNFRYETVKKTLEENTIGFLPYRDHDGSVILVLKFGAWNPHLNTAAESLRAMTTGALHAISKPATQVCGMKIIGDFKGFTIGHLPHISPTYVWLLGEAIQSCLPTRVRGVHLVNETHIIGYLWAIMKPLLSKKMRERFHFHGKNVKKLHKYFHPSILPVEYEGELLPFDNKEWSKLVEQFADEMVTMTTYGYKKHGNKK